MSEFKVGVTYKLSAGALSFITAYMGTEFAGEAGVFKVEEVTDVLGYSDDVTSSRTTERFSIPHFMADDCTVVEEVLDA